MFGWFNAAIVRASCSKRRVDRVHCQSSGSTLNRDITPEPRCRVRDTLAHAACTEAVMIRKALAVFREGSPWVSRQLRIGRVYRI